mgnify:CR=1 FL=1
MSNSGNTLWHGRFEGGPAAELMAYTESLSFDQRLWPDDIDGSRAHVKGLRKVGILTEAECESVLRALDQVAQSLIRPIARPNITELADRRYLLVSRMGDQRP